MIRIHFLLILCSFASLTESAITVYQPLVFDPFTLEIYDFGVTSSTYNDGPYAVACPAAAKNNHEHDFNKKFSLNYKALFVRHFSNKKDDLMNQFECSSNVEVAVAYYKDPNSKKRFLKYGYEIYFSTSEYPDLNDSLTYSHYKRVFHKKKQFFSLCCGFTKMLLLAEDGDSGVRQKEMDFQGFIWISEVTLVEFKKSKWRSNSFYSINKKSNKPAIKCDYYKLHNRWYNKKLLDYYYSSQRQKEIFKSVKLSKNDCKSKYNCVEKYSLVPAYQLQFGVSETAPCTDFATVPIWSKIAAPLLDSLDKFLFAVAQAMDDTRKLKIYPNVFDILTLPKAGGKINQMYLYPEKKKLEVPKYILKLVAYHTYDCDVTFAVCWYLVVIVIHNHPNVPDVKEKLCADKCEELGFKSIQYIDKSDPKKKSEYIYCCEMTDIMKQIFKFPRLLEYQVLDLKKFPRYDKDTDKYKSDENKTDQIEAEMKHFFGDEKPSEGRQSRSPEFS